MQFLTRFLLAACAVLALAFSLSAHAAGQLIVLTHYDLISAGQAGPSGAKPSAILGTYAKAAAKESGAVSVRVLADPARSGRFTVLEIWADEAAYKAHGSAASKAQLTSAIKPWEVGPADERSHVDFK
jgi:quinol monooxygenase YgiN